MTLIERQNRRRIAAAFAVGLAGACAAPALAQQPTATRQDVIAACTTSADVAAMFGVKDLGGPGSPHILDLNTAVQARRLAMSGGANLFGDEVDKTKRRINDIEGRLRNRMAKPYPSDEGMDACYTRYLALLQSLDEPSLTAVRQQLAGESARRIDDQRQARAAAQKLQDERDAEAARRHKEDATIAAEAEDERKQRAAKLAAQPAAPLLGPSTGPQDAAQRAGNGQ